MKEDALRVNLSLAKATWGPIPKPARRGLEELTARYALSVALGDFQFFGRCWYVTHSGLLRLANRNRCCGIRVLCKRELSVPASHRWVFRATVYKSARCRGFVGYGDADPSNVSSLMHGAELRIAETRAVNRALRKAYGIGLCPVEELGSVNRPSAGGWPAQNKPTPAGNNGHQNGAPRLRDRLCLLIRQHHLDAGLVNAYAADYCGTATLREASRDQVEAFINELAERATKDRAELICQLNSYARPQEVSL